MNYAYITFHNLYTYINSGYFQPITCKCRLGKALQCRLSLQAAYYFGIDEYLAMVKTANYHGAMWDSKWVHNSLARQLSDDEPFIIGVYVSMIIGGFVILHGFHLHGLRFNSVRVSTDVTAIATIVDSICFLCCRRYYAPSSVHEL